MIPTRLRVMTVHLGADDAMNGHPWEQRMLELARVVQAYEPALIGVQHGTREQIEGLVAAMPGFQAALEHRRWQEGLFYTAVLFRGEEIEVEDLRDLWLSETPRVRGSSSWGASTPAVATMTELRHPASRRQLLFASVELDPTVERARLQQAAVLVQPLTKGNSEKLPVVVAGSFYEGPEGAVARLLTGRRVVNGLTGTLQDAWRKLGRPDEEGKTWQPSGAPSIRADWILFDAPLELQDVSRIDPGSDGALYSDHAPVGAELLL